MKHRTKPLLRRRQPASRKFAAGAVAVLVVAIGVASHVAVAGGGRWIPAEGSGCALWHPDPLPGQKVRWSGPCRLGRAHGAGVAEWFIERRPPDRCECTFVNGKAQGNGVFYWADGAMYAGEFRDGVMEGFGYIRYPDNETYEGEFRNGLPNGFGTLLLPDNTRIMGKFKDGAPVTR